MRSSVDNYSTTLLSGSFDTTYSTYTTYTVDLSGASFQNLAQATAFRIYTWLDTATNPAAAFDNVTINGEVTGGGGGGTVPEPSTAIAMSLLGLAGFAGNRRRRRTALNA